jgi:hypothetical protein
MGRGHFPCSATPETERHSQSSLPQETRLVDSAREATSLLNAARRSSSGKCAACFRIATEHDPVHGIRRRTANEW